MTGIGTLIDGKYEIITKLGEGGMSYVWLAMDKRLNKQWAIKEIKLDADEKNNPVLKKSFIEEANLMKRFDHPVFPRIVDIISAETIYIVMDYVEGESLDKVLMRNGPQQQELVVDWAKQICDALQYLHTRKPPIIYRDMKPANVMLRPEGNIKILDFGIAREYKDNGLSDTTVLGTRGYAPPEQYGLRQTDQRSDIYAIGMTMHHLLTGQDPRQQDYLYKPIREWNPGLHEGIERIIDICVSPDPRDRYQTCAELLYALEHYENDTKVFRKKQKIKLAVFSLSVVISLLSLASGILFRYAAWKENAENYQNLIEAQGTYEQQMNSYKLAVELYPDKTETYIKILETYDNNGLFRTVDESGNAAEVPEFSALYNKNYTLLSKQDDFAELNYKIGTTYLYLYEDENGNGNLETRAYKAKSYFETAADEQYKNEYFYGPALSYYEICRFYTDFVISSSNVKEPMAEDYINMLEAMKSCIAVISEYSSNDSGYVKLNLYKSISSLFTYNRCRSMSVSGVDISLPEELLDMVRTEAEDVLVTQDLSMVLKQDVLSKCTEGIKNIEDAYQEGR